MDNDLVRPYSEITKVSDIIWNQVASKVTVVGDVFEDDGASVLTDSPRGWISFIICHLFTVDPTTVTVGTATINENVISLLHQQEVVTETVVFTSLRRREIVYSVNWNTEVLSLGCVLIVTVNLTFLSVEIREVVDVDSDTNGGVMIWNRLRVCVF